MLKKLTKFINEKILAFIFVSILVLSTMPIIYVGLFNYATGDDLRYGAIVKRAFINHLSASETWKNIWADILAQYNSIQGTWSSQLLWCFEPSVFGEKFYILTIFIALISLIGGIMYFLYILLVKTFNYSISVYLIVSSLVSFFSIQYMPYPRSGFYWFTGMTHYTFPYGLSLLAIALTINHILKRSYSSFIIATIIFLYLGGSGYPSIVISGLGIFYVFLFGFLSKNTVYKKRALFLILPGCLELIGFAISAASPGNSNRGGSDYDFSIDKVFFVFSRCFSEGITYVFKIFIELRPLILLVLFTIIIAFYNKPRVTISFKKWLTIALGGLFIVCMTRSPEFYAGASNSLGFSGGVYNTYFLITIIYIAITTLSLGSYLSSIFSFRITKSIAYSITVSVSLFFCIFLFKHLIGNALLYNCYEYISSGRLDDFELQMQERIEILEKSTDENIILPFMNDEQGPLMHMAITSDPNGYTNTVTAAFYGKTSIIAIDRQEWEALYK